MSTMSRMRLRDRYLTVLCTLAVVTVIVSLTLSSAAAQAPATSANGESLKTVWGEPDLQGIWNSTVVEPLERAKEFGAREFMTPQKWPKPNRI